MDMEFQHRITAALEKIADELKANLPAIEIDLNLLQRNVEQLVILLSPAKATELTLKYTLQGGSSMGSPVSGTVGQVYDPTIVESNATTPSIQPIGPLVYASDIPAVVTVDPNTGIATLVAAGTANVSVLDQGNSLTDTMAFTVAAPVSPATKLDLEYSLAPAAKRKG